MGRARGSSRRLCERAGPAKLSRKPTSVTCVGLISVMERRPKCQVSPQKCGGWEKEESEREATEGGGMILAVFCEAEHVPDHARVELANLNCYSFGLKDRLRFSLCVISVVCPSCMSNRFGASWHIPKLEAIQGNVPGKG